MHRTIQQGGQVVVLGTGHADGGLRGLAGGQYRSVLHVPLVSDGSCAGGSGGGSGLQTAGFVGVPGAGTGGHFKACQVQALGGPFQGVSGWLRHDLQFLFREHTRPTDLGQQSWGSPLSSGHCRDNPDVQMRFLYSEPLAHQIYAAADMLLVPSMFEPCGLTQVGGAGRAQLSPDRSVGIERCCCC